MLLMMDNYDSFTWNLVQYLGELGATVKVVRNDAITLDDVEALNPQHIVISPGPCTPTEAGISVPLIRRFAGKIPVLGVCLGHQAIGQAFGGRVIRAQRVMHGKLSSIVHDQRGVFADCPVAVQRDPVPFARHRAVDAAARARRHRDGGGRRDHGRAPPRAARSKACSSIPKRS